jgi:hypothetical protein
MKHPYEKMLKKDLVKFLHDKDSLIGELRKDLETNSRVISVLDRRATVVDDLILSASRITDSAAHAVTDLTSILKRR